MDFLFTEYEYKILRIAIHLQVTQMRCSVVVVTKTSSNHDRKLLKCFGVSKNIVELRK